MALWRIINERVLSSSVCQNLSHWLNQDLEHILGLLVFHDPTGIMTWKVDSWEPLAEMVDLIDRWVAVMGHHPRCFHSLIGMLHSIGMPLMPTYGIKWLQTCMERAGDPARLLRGDDSHISYTLADLLHDTWHKYSEALRQDRTTWRQFVMMIDYLAYGGEQAAVELQRKIQELSS